MPGLITNVVTRTLIVFGLGFMYWPILLLSVIFIVIPGNAIHRCILSDKTRAAALPLVLIGFVSDLAMLMIRGCYIDFCDPVEMQNGAPGSPLHYEVVQQQIIFFCSWVVVAICEAGSWLLVRAGLGRTGFH